MRQDDMNPMQITDGAIREMFDRRSRQADAEDLRAMILAATVGERQRRGWYGVLRSHSPSGPARVLVLALITIAAVVGAVVGAAALRDDLVPRATAANFVRPFDFVMPAAVGLRLRVGKSAMVAWTSGPDLSPPPPRTTSAEADNPLHRNNAGSSSARPRRRGVTAAAGASRSRPILTSSLPTCTTSPECR